MSEVVVKYYPRQHINKDGTIVTTKLKRTYTRGGRPAGRPRCNMSPELKQQIYDAIDEGSSMCSIYKSLNIPYSAVRRIVMERQ